MRAPTLSRLTFRGYWMTNLPVLELGKIIMVSLEDLPALLDKYDLHIRGVDKDLVFILEPKEEEGKNVAE